MACISEAHRPPIAAPEEKGTQRTWPRLASPLCARSSKIDESTQIPAEFDRPLDGEELMALSRKLGRLSPDRVADAYRQAHDECRMNGGRLPPASALQELVIAWRLTNAWQLRTPVDRIGHSTRGC